MQTFTIIFFIYIYGQRCLESPSASETSFTSSVLSISTSTESGLSFTAELSVAILLAISSLRPSSILLVSSRNNLGRDVEVSPQILDTLSSKVAVRILPGVGNTNVSPRFKRFHQHEYLKIGGSFNVGVSGRNGVLLDYTYSLFEEVREYSDTVGLWDEL